jgi:hypothetical protein
MDVMLAVALAIVVAMAIVVVFLLLYEGAIGLEGTRGSTVRGKGVDRGRNGQEVEKDPGSSRNVPSPA